MKRGLRFVHGGEKELVEKLGREDPCPCRSGKRFQAVLHVLRPVSTARSGRTIGGSDPADEDACIDASAVARVIEVAAAA